MGAAVLQQKCGGGFLSRGMEAADVSLSLAGTNSLSVRVTVTTVFFSIHIPLFGLQLRSEIVLV